MAMYGIYKKNGRKVAKRPLAVVTGRTMSGAVDYWRRRTAAKNRPKVVRVYRVKVRKKR